MPPVTGAGAVVRRRRRTGLGVVSGPSAVTAADDASLVFRKSRRRARPPGGAGHRPETPPGRSE